MRSSAARFLFTLDGVRVPSSWSASCIASELDGTAALSPGQESAETTSLRDAADQGPRNPHTQALAAMLSRYNLGYIAEESLHSPNSREP